MENLCFNLSKRSHYLISQWLQKYEGMVDIKDFGFLICSLKIFNCYQNSIKRSSNTDTEPPKGNKRLFIKMSLDKEVFPKHNSNRFFCLIRQNFTTELPLKQYHARKICSQSEIPWLASARKYSDLPSQNFNLFRTYTWTYQNKTSYPVTSVCCLEVLGHLSFNYKINFSFSSSPTYTPMQNWSCFSGKT